MIIEEQLDTMSEWDKIESREHGAEIRATKTSNL